MAEIAKLHPSDFTKSEIAMKALKRKRWFGLLSTENLKGAHFDPDPLPLDHTIDEYHKRIRTQLPQDREKLHFSIPFEGQLNSTMNLLEKLQNELEKYQREREQSEREMEELKKKHEREAKAKFMLFLGNMLISLARRLAKQYAPAVKDNICTSKLQQLVLSISDTQLREAGVPTKVWPFLRDFKNYVGQRNEEAHESAAAFAYLLQRMATANPDVLDQWRGCFELVYGASVEKMAEEGKKMEEDEQKDWNKALCIKN